MEPTSTAPAETPRSHNIGYGNSNHAKTPMKPRGAPEHPPERAQERAVGNPTPVQDRADTAPGLQSRPTESTPNTAPESRPAPAGDQHKPETPMPAQGPTPGSPNVGHRSAPIHARQAQEPTPRPPTTPPDPNPGAPTSPPDRPGCPPAGQDKPTLRATRPDGSATPARPQAAPAPAAPARGPSKNARAGRTPPPTPKTARAAAALHTNTPSKFSPSSENSPVRTPENPLVIPLRARIWDMSGHPRQREFVESVVKRKVVRAGRRGGKTVGVAILAVREFSKGRRVLYAGPTIEQVQRFWTEVKHMLQPSVVAGAVRINETEHLVEVRGTEARIRAKTAWNADTLRGDYADVLILDEWQMMNEDAWEVVGQPMLLDNDGDAIFIYTPPSLRQNGVSKARDPQHAAKLFRRAQQDGTGRWGTYTFPSHANPHISKDALSEIAKDMSNLAYRQEILAEDVDQAPGALWRRADIDAGRCGDVPSLERIVVGLDPSASSTGDEAGIVTVGSLGADLYVLSDDSRQGSPEQWGRAAAAAYEKWCADCIVAEKNQGGEMILSVMAGIDRKIPVRLVHASRGKQPRAEPVAVRYEQHRGHHVGVFAALENEMCLWTPGEPSPNRCLAAGTMVSVPGGEVPIERVSAGDWVMTRRGARRVLASGITGRDEKVLLLTLSSGTTLTMTPEHEVWVIGRGFVPAWTIEPSDPLAGPSWRLLSSTAWSTGATPWRPVKKTVATFGHTRKANGFRTPRACTLPSGNPFTDDPFRRGDASIISMEILSTTIRRTLSASQPSSTPGFMLRSGPRNGVGRWIGPERTRLCGTAASRDANGTASTAETRGWAERQSSRLPARSAGRSSRAISTTAGKSDSAAANALSTSILERDGTEPRAHARYAERRFDHPERARREHAAIRVLRVEPGAPCDVYNLRVEGDPEFFANGILVHNCDALVWAATHLMAGGDDAYDDTDLLRESVMYLQ